MPDKLSHIPILDDPEVVQAMHHLMPILTAEAAASIGGRLRAQKADRARARVEEGSGTEHGLTGGSDDNLAAVDSAKSDVDI
jgi:hypothetical protein